MKSLGAHKPLKGSTHLIPKAHKLLKATSPREMITVTLIVRRRKGGSKLREVKDFSARANAVHEPVSRERFSAVAPLYAGLFARINSKLGVSAGFVNQILYSLGKTAFRDTVAPPGPKNNSFNGVTGYPVEKGWDACTGWGSVQDVALQNGLKAANAGSKLST